MGRKKQGKSERPVHKGKDTRHRMKGKSLETFTEEMHEVLQGLYCCVSPDLFTTIVCVCIMYCVGVYWIEFVMYQTVLCISSQ